MDVVWAIVKGRHLDPMEMNKKFPRFVQMSKKPQNDENYG